MEFEHVRIEILEEGDNTKWNIRALKCGYDFTDWKH